MCCQVYGRPATRDYRTWWRWLRTLALQLRLVGEEGESYKAFGVASCSGRRKNQIEEILIVLQDPLRRFCSRFTILSIFLHYSPRSRAKMRRDIVLLSFSFAASTFASQAATYARSLGLEKRQTCDIAGGVGACHQAAENCPWQFPGEVADWVLCYQDTPAEGGIYWCYNPAMGETCCSNDSTFQPCSFGYEDCRD